MEHMLFLGCKKYPAESGLDEFLGSHGGSTNAVTEYEHTLFSLEVDQADLEEALDRFASVFADPLLKLEALKRELKAIDNEFELSLQKDKDRVEQLFANIVQNTHPMSKLPWGNAESLKDVNNVHHELQEFHKKFYGAQHMTLAVQATGDLDKLEDMVRKTFSSIKTSIIPKPQFANLNPPYEGTAFNKMIKVISVGHEHKILLSWCVRSEESFYRTKPLTFVSWLLNHEGRGSVAYYLRQKCYIQEFEVGVGAHSNSCCSIFTITIALSEVGFTHLPEVVAAIFDVIFMLEQLQDLSRTYTDFQRIHENSLRWQQQDKESELVDKLAIAMLRYPANDICTGDALMEYDQQHISDVLRDLKPEKVNLMILSRSFSATDCNLMCPWFKTKYGIEDIPTTWMQRFTAPQPNSKFCLPPSNAFIATDFMLKAIDHPISENPTLISNSTVINLWYKRDRTFKVPLGYVNIEVTVSLDCPPLKRFCLVEVFCKLIESALIEETFSATLANCRYTIQGEPGGISIQFSGFSQFLLRLIHIVVGHVFSHCFAEEQLHIAVEEIRTDLLNEIEAPDKLNEDLMMALLGADQFTMVQKLACFSDISVEDLNGLQKAIHSSTVKILVQGNITHQEAKDLELFLTGLLDAGIQPPDNSDEASYIVTKLPGDASYLRRKNGNVTDRNCVITNYYQHGPATLDDKLMMEILTEQMSTPLFKQLRTKEQWGYHVDCSVHELHGVVGYCITMHCQSTKFSMLRLDNAIERFLSRLDMTINEWCTDPAYDELVEAKIENLEGPASSLQDEVEENWTDILNDSVRFDSSQQKIEALKGLTAEQYRKFCEQHLKPSSLQRRKLSVQVVGSSALAPSASAQATGRARERDAIPKKSTKKFIDDVDEFKKDCDFYLV